MGHGRKKCTLSHFQFITWNFSHNSPLFSPFSWYGKTLLQMANFLSVWVPEWLICVCVCVPAQSCMTLCDPLDRSPPASSVHGVFQARVLEGVVVSFSRGSSRPRDGSYIFSTGRQTLNCCTTWEAGMTAVCRVKNGDFTGEE